MQQFIGTKIINAKPINRADYNTFRGWPLPENENGADEGYLVEHTDGGKPNVEGYAGYVRWSPKEQFEKAYLPTADITFGLAIEALRKGLKVARAAWNGTGIFLILVPGTPNLNFTPNTPYARAGVMHGDINPHIDMYTTGSFQPGWQPTQVELLATDWQIIN